MIFSFAALWGFVVEEAIPEIEAPAVAAAEQSTLQFSVMDLIFGSTPVVQGVLLLLVVMSLWTWMVVFSKTKAIWQVKKETEAFEDLFWSSKNLAQISEAAGRYPMSPVAHVFQAGHRELTALVSESDAYGIENVERALRKARAEEISRLEYGTTMLATTASAAPFIGLFGTVWGIMHAFIGLSSVKSSSIQAVAPGISEALIATAIGLGAAIPAAIFYNYFMQQLRVITRSMDAFSAEFLNISRRHFLKK